MIAGLIGTIHGVAPDAVLVNVGGVIYRVNTSGRTGPDAGGVGAAVELFTHLVVREDAQILYGFLTEQELAWFQTLIGVNGVGPRLACAVLGRFTPDALIDVIHAEEVAMLSTVPGIGRRTASRIVLDLRGKLPERLEGAGALPGSAQGDPEALAALQALGYSTAEALGALSSLPAGERGTTEEQVVAALRLLGNA
jgi:Holliday junction DNA helicase RuvA